MYMYGPIRFTNELLSFQLLLRVMDAVVWTALVLPALVPAPPLTRPRCAPPGADLLPPCASHARTLLPRASQAPAMVAKTTSGSLDSPADQAEELMKCASGNGMYLAAVFATLGLGFHATIPFASLSGVLMDGAISADLGLSAETVALSDAILLLSWAPGSLLCGPWSDVYGRKTCTLGFGLLTALATASIGLIPAGEHSLLLLCAARAASGFCIGGMMSAAYTLVVESVDASRRGRASLSWSVGYVGALLILAAIHTAAPALADASGASAWRVEEAMFGGCGVAFAALTQLVVVETPKFYASRGDMPSAVASARAIGTWNGVDALPDVDDTTLALGASRGARGGGEAAAAEGEEGASWAVLFAPAAYLWSTLTLGGIQLSWNCAYYTLNFSAG